MPFRFDHPEALWLLTLAPLIVALGLRSMAATDRARRWSAIGLRLVTLLVIVLMLAGFEAVRWHDDMTVIAVVDESESVRRFVPPPEQKAETDVGKPGTIHDFLHGWLGASSARRRQDDRIGVVGYDGRPIVRSVPSAVLGPDTAGQTAPRDGTDTASALRLAMAMFPADTGRRLVLATDGRDQSPADLLAAAREAAAARIHVDVLPLEYRLDREVMVDAVVAPAEAREGQTIPLRVVLRAARPAAGTLFVRHDADTVRFGPPGRSTPGAAITPADWSPETGAASDKNAPTGDAAGPARFVCVRLVDVPVTVPGMHKFEAIFEPEKGQDRIAANNRAESYTLVHGRGRVLFIDNPDPARPDAGLVLPRALKSHGIELDVLPAAAIPDTPRLLQRYDAVVLQNVPAEQVPPVTQRMLARYVSELGGGLVMIGGPDAFGAGGWTDTPIDRVLPVECRVPNQKIVPSGALVIVLDCSGSMHEPMPGSSVTKQEAVNEAAVLAVSTLYLQDLVGVVRFNGSASWVVPLHVNADPHVTAKKIREIKPFGGTNIQAGMEEALNALAPLTPEDAAVRHVILLTDGQSVGGRFQEIARAMAAKGITLTTIGVGQDVNAELLTELAKLGGGSYHPINDVRRLPQVFIKEARTIRKTLIREKEFQPKVVNTGSPVTAGLPGPPPLRGFVLTGEKRDARVFRPMSGPEGEPLLAHWQVGLGRTAAFTSDATSRWATPWLPWGGYPDFWSRLVRHVARPAEGRGYDLSAVLSGDTLRLRLDAAGAEPADRDAKRPSFANQLKVVGAVTHPDGSTTPVRLRQTAPGIYEATVNASAQGNHIASLLIDGPGGERATVIGGASRPAGAELREFTSNQAILEEVASITGGRLLSLSTPEAGLLFGRDGVEPTRSVRPVWRELLVALLAIFLIDVAARRVAWDGGAIAAWVRSQLATGRDTPREEEAAQATLAALRARADALDKELGPREEPPVRDTSQAATRKRAPRTAEAPSAPSTAAPTPTDSAPPTSPPASPPNVGTETTSRLLDAKRRRIH